MTPLVSHVPFLATPGNHEIEVQTDGTKFASYTVSWGAVPVMTGGMPRVLDACRAMVGFTGRRTTALCGEDGAGCRCLQAPGLHPACTHASLVACHSDGADALSSQQRGKRQFEPPLALPRCRPGARGFPDILCALWRGHRAGVTGGGTDRSAAPNVRARCDGVAWHQCFLGLHDDCRPYARTPSLSMTG